MLVSPGNYGPVTLEDRNHSANSPVLIQKNGSGIVSVRGASLAGNTLDITNSSYYVFDGIRFEKGLRAVEIKKSKHLIFNDCEMTGAGQEGVHIMQNSEYIDIIGGKIWNVGKLNPQWGECIYLGSAQNKPWYPDYTHHVWIKNVELHNCGMAEAIDFKGHVSNSTVKNCRIHDISPGTASQWNDGAISAGSENDGTPRRDNWIELNHIYSISGGLHNHGVVFYGGGHNIKNNKIQDCDERGIYGNGYNNGNYVTYIYNNDIDNCAPELYVYSGIKASYDDPGKNPYSAQDWYKKKHEVALPTIPSNVRLNVN